MIVTTERKHWSDAELMALPDDGHKYELLDGELIMSPAGFEHGDISVALVTALSSHVRMHRLGAVLDSSTGFKMKNGDVLSPDVSFVAKVRLAGLKRLPRGFFRGAPDLAVEVLSPDDTVDKLQRKLLSYFANGTRLAWVINPEERSVQTSCDLSSKKVLGPRDRMDGDEVVPGFSMPIADLFAPYPWADE